MSVQISIFTEPAEKGHVVFSVDFTDEAAVPVAVIPTAITWSLTDRIGTVINARTAVPFTPPAASIEILVSGDDLAVPEPSDTVRKFLLEWVYTSATLGAGIPAKAEVTFKIADLVGVT